MANPPSSTDTEKEPAAHRLFGWIWNWRSPGRAILNLVVLCALLWGFYAEENRRGKRDWVAYERHLKDAGVELDWNKLVPPPVPDDQNFAMTPFMAPMFDFNPRPLDMGQSPWRNFEGWSRTTNYAAALGTTNEFWKGESDLQAGLMTDLEAVLYTIELNTNSAATKPTFSTRAQSATAVLAACEQFMPVLEELRTASHRPYCRYNVNFDQDNPMEILLPHLGFLRRLDRLLQVRASAELELGKADDAFADVKFIMYLADTLRNDPFVISHAMRLSILRAAQQIIWEGLAEHRWSDPQLAELQNGLLKIRVMDYLTKPLMDRDVASGCRLFEFIRTHPNGFRDITSYADMGFWPSALLIAPSGWLYEEEISCQRLYKNEVPKFCDAHETQIYPGAIEEFWNRMERQKTHEFSAFRHHTIFMHLLVPNLHRLFQNTAITQTDINEASLACALERYRVAKGKYPVALAALVPQFMDRLPQDVCGGQPLKYRLGNDGCFALYSVGWDGKDDNGMIATVKGGQPDENKGDWVWPRNPDKQRALN